MSGNWLDQRFERVMIGGIAIVRGPVYKGLGLTRSLTESGVWYLIHLGSGHAVCQIQTHSVERVKLIGATFAEIADWDFMGLNGWKNRDPEIWDKTTFLIRSFPECAAGDGTKTDDRKAISIGLRRTGS